jgi:hypothetical protein
VKARVNWSDTLYTVVHRFHPDGNFRISLEGAAKALDPNLMVGDIGLCNDDKLIVIPLPPPQRPPGTHSDSSAFASSKPLIDRDPIAPVCFVFAETGDEKDLELGHPDVAVGTAAMSTGWPLPNERVYLYEKDFIDPSTLVGSLCGTGPIEIFAVSQRLSFHSSSGQVWPLPCSATCTCAEAISLLQNHKAHGLSGTRIKLYSDEGLQDEICGDTALLTRCKRRDLRNELYCRVWRPYRFQFRYRGDISEGTEWFADDLTVCSSQEFFESKSGCDVRLSVGGCALRKASLLFDVADDVVLCEQFDPEYTFQLPNGQIEKRALPPSTRCCDLTKLFDAFEYDFFFSSADGTRAQLNEAVTLAANPTKHFELEIRYSPSRDLGPMNFAVSGRTRRWTPSCPSFFGRKDGRFGIRTGGSAGEQIV